MASPRNAALSWLVTTLRAAQPNVLVERNEPQPERMLHGSAIIIQDSADGADFNREDMLGMATLCSSFEVGAAVDIYSDRSDSVVRTNRLYELAEAVSDVIMADRTMGGNIAVATIDSVGQLHQVLGDGRPPMGQLQIRLMMVYDTVDNPIG